MKYTLLDHNQTDARYKISEDGIVQTLTSRMGTGGGFLPMVIEQKKAYCVGNGQADQASPTETMRALNCIHDQQAVFDDEEYILRRITPLEAERLQGFPDNWTEGESDTARYKALGNSLALPNALYVIAGIAKYGKED